MQIRMLIKVLVITRFQCVNLEEKAVCVQNFKIFTVIFTYEDVVTMVILT